LPTKFEAPWYQWPIEEILDKLATDNTLEIQADYSTKISEVQLKWSNPLDLTAVHAWAGVVCAIVARSSVPTEKKNKILLDHIKELSDRLNPLIALRR
jgi:hypothetical protein